VVLLAVAPRAGHAQDTLDVAEIGTAIEGGVMHMVAAGGTDVHLRAGFHPQSFEPALVEARTFHVVLGGLALARLAPAFVTIGMRWPTRFGTREWAAGGVPYLALGGLFTASAVLSWTAWARYRQARRSHEAEIRPSELWRSGTASLVVLMATAIGTSLYSPVHFLLGALSVASLREHGEARRPGRPPPRVALVPTGPGLALVGRF